MCEGVKQIEKLIKHKLSYRFGILNDSEYNHNIKTQTDPFDNEYKLWYSRYRYGKFFHIKTEYVHTMSNISDKTHGYQYSITLEEIIYACVLLNVKSIPFFQDLNINYQSREFQINNKTKIELINLYKLLEKKGFRSNKVFDLYNQYKLKDKKTNTNKFLNNTIDKELLIKFKKNINTIKFILMFKTINQEYIFIYLVDKFYYKILIKSNIKNIIIDIIKYINIVKNLNFKNINLNNHINLYKIVNISIVNPEYCKNIFEVNPTLMKTLKKEELDKLDAFVFYGSELLDNLILLILLILLNLLNLLIYIICINMINQIYLDQIILINRKNI